MSVFTRSVMTVSHAGPVERAITASRAGRALAHRFVAGDDIDAAVSAATRSNDAGLLVSLDLLGEEVSDRAGIEHALEEYVDGLHRIAGTGLQANISVKLTQLGLSIDQELAMDALARLADTAKTAGTTVTVDMEDSRFTSGTLDLYEDAQRRFGNLGVCLQAYLKRTPADLERVLPLGGHIRLCKGAYVEPPDIAFQHGHDVDAAFARLLMPLMGAEEVRPAIATHDPALIELTLSLAERRTAGFEFQMLYGVRQDEQLRLRGLGHDVRVYLPYGSAWYPYLTRRLAERPANAWFFVRSLLGR